MRLPHLAASSALLTLFLLTLTSAALANDDEAIEDDSLLEIEIIRPTSATRRARSTALSSSLYCSNPAPGLDRLRRGIDISKLDFLPLDANDDDGFRQPVVDYTCNDGRKVRIRAPGGQQVEYDLPDQVWDVTAVPGGMLSSHVDIFKNSLEIRKSMAADAGVDLFGGMFSASGSYKKMSYSLTNSSRYVEDVRSFVSSSRADLAPSWALNISRYAKMFIDRQLPSKFDDGPEKFEQFFQHFGTHMFLGAKMGGSIHIMFETQKSYFLGKSERHVQAQAKGSYLNILKANGGYTGATTKVDERFTAATTTTIRYHGGDANVLSEDGLKKWQPTVAERPWIFGGTLTPLASLIADAGKRGAMERAVQVHTDKARLRAARDIVYGKMRTYTPASELNSMLAETKRLLVLASPDHSAVNAICDKIETQLSIPSWFSDVQLCYRWYPDGDGGQCGGGVGRELCARPDEFTTYYRDDTDRRGGGCRMSWGLKAPQNAPSWFRRTKVCFRWFPDGDGGQCGGGAARNLCATVGQWTAYYRDDTDRRGGGCRMSWGLQAATSTPIWVRNLNFCYQWYPDGDGGQCGGGVGRNLCAKTNGWTTYYRDDTDRRGGGCRMRWGITTN